jgi:hypothetical protein
MNQEGLRKLYSSDKTARIFLDHMSTRQRNQNETKVDRILKVLGREGHSVTRGDIVGLFRSLQDIECGQFVTGRHGWPSRFVWDVGLTSVARIAAGENSEVEQIAAEGADDEVETELIAHVLNLRPTLEVTFDLPVDLTEREAERLASFISSLPMEEYD